VLCAEVELWRLKVNLFNEARSLSEEKLGQHARPATGTPDQLWSSSSAIRLSSGTFNDINAVKDLFNCVTLDSVLDLISSGAQAWPLSRERGNQLWELDNIEDAPEIVGERGQAELGANLLQPSHQKRTLVHPLLDRAKRVFDRLAALVEDVGALCYAGLHSIQHGLVLETGYGAELIAGALRSDRAVSAGLAVAVIDLLQAAHQRRRIGIKALTRWAKKAVAGWVLAELRLYGTDPL
jgi:hypothetical protein